MRNECVLSWPPDQYFLKNRPASIAWLLLRPLRSAPRLHVVTPQLAQVPDVEPTIGHDGIRPCLFPLNDALRLLRRPDASFLAIPLRRWFDEHHVAVLQVQIQPSVRVEGRRRRRPFLPF